MNLPEVKPDQLPPHNIDAELRVIGSILLDEQILNEIVSILKPEDFFRESFGIIYATICRLYDRSEPIIPLSIVEELGRRDEFERAGGEETIRQAMEETPSAVNGLYYAHIVAQRATSRNLIEAARQILREGYSNQFTADELLSRADLAVARISAGRTTDRTKTAADATNASMAAYADRLNGIQSGIPTGLAALDDMIGGLRPKRLIVIAARPSIGKSSLVTTVLFNVASAGFPVLIFSLEMDHAEIGDRLICGHSGVDGHAYSNPYRMRGDDHAAVEEANRVVSRLPIFIDDDSTKSIRQIAAKARRAVIRDGVKVIAIDYLQLLESDDPRSRESRSEFVAGCSRRLKNLATELDVPLILVSQLNREAEKRDKKRPALADLRESGAIEQDANTVALIHRPDFYDSSDQPGVTELIIAKNRGGRTGVIKLGFRKGQTRFVDYDDPLPICLTREEEEPFG